MESGSVVFVPLRGVNCFRWGSGLTAWTNGSFRPLAGCELFLKFPLKILKHGAGFRPLAGCGLFQMNFFGKFANQMGFRPLAGCELFLVF